MKKALKQIASALVLAVAAALPAQAIDTNTYTNVLQNINIALTVYEQGSTNSATDWPKDLHQLTTPFILKELALLNPGTNFTGAKLVVATSYFTNNQYVLTVMSSNYYGTYPASNGYNFVPFSGVVTSNFTLNTFSNYTSAQAISNYFWNNFGLATTNSGYTNDFGNGPFFYDVTAVTGPTVVIGNNKPGEVGILVGKQFTPLTNYFNSATYFTNNDYYDNWNNQPSFVTSLSDDSANGNAFAAPIAVPDIIAGTGKNLNTTNANFNAGTTKMWIGDANVFMVSTNLGPTAFTNLNFDLYGMVKQTLVIDTLHGTNRANEFSVTADVTAAGAIGGQVLSVPDNGNTNFAPPNTYTVGQYSTYIPNQLTNFNAQSTTLFYVTNYMPALIEGTITLTPLPNEAVGGPIPSGN